MHLVLVESSIKGKNLFHFLQEKQPDQWKVFSTEGLIFEPDPGTKKSINIFNEDFSVNLATKSKVAEQRLQTIKEWASKVDSIFMGFDETPEGEFIAWSLLPELTKHCDISKIKRIIFNQLDAQCLQAFKQVYSIDTQLAVGYSKWLAVNACYDWIFELGACELHLLKKLSQNTSNNLPQNKYKVAITTNYPKLILSDSLLSSKEDAKIKLNKIQKAIEDKQVSLIKETSIITEKPQLPFTLRSFVLTQNPLHGIQYVINLYHAGWISNPRQAEELLEAGFLKQSLEFLNEQITDIDYSRTIENPGTHQSIVPLKPSADFRSVPENWRGAYYQIWKNACLFSINFDKEFTDLTLAVNGQDCSSFKHTSPFMTYSGWDIFEKTQQVPDDIQIEKVVLIRETDKFASWHSLKNLYKDFEFIGLDSFIQAIKNLSQKNLIKIVESNISITWQGYNFLNFLTEKTKSFKKSKAATISNCLIDVFNLDLFKKFFDKVLDPTSQQVQLFDNLHETSKTLSGIKDTISNEICDVCGSHLLLKQDSISENCYLQCSRFECRIVYCVDFVGTTPIKFIHDQIIDYDCEQVSTCGSRKHNFYLNKFTRYLECLDCKHKINLF